MRIYVERQDGYDTKAQSMLREIGGYLGIMSLTGLRFITGFDVSGISEAQLDDVKYSVFGQKGRDIITDNPSVEDSDYFYATRYLDHQYDQKSEISETLIRLSFPESQPKVKTLQLIVLYGVSQTEGDTIKEYYLNPLEAQEASLSQPVNWNYGGKEPMAVATLKGFADFNKDELAAFKVEYGIAMNYPDLKFCQQYFAQEGADPTVTELKILDTYWSDHCRHSTFQTVLNSVELESSPNQAGLQAATKSFNQAHSYVYTGERPLCLMDIATMEMKKLSKQGKLTDLEKSEEINACSIEVSGEVDGKTEEFILMFKNETHNHPTEMEPFGGAGTCIGGCIRDPLSGRAHVFGAARLTGAADPREAVGDTIPGKLPQRTITKTAADGYSDYANQIGVASGFLEEYYDEGFKAKRMECGALVAYNYKKNITRGNGVPGDVIIMLGGKTGRDGLGGATGSSQTQQGDSEAYSAEVQKGNPQIERNIIRLFRKPDISPMIKKSNDFGAGGVSVAIGEMANSLKIDLDRVPLKYIGLNGTEVAISESQERMAVLLDKKDADRFIEAAKQENLIAVQVAQVTDDNRIVMHYRGQTVCSLKSDFLNSGGERQSADVVVAAPRATTTAKRNENISAGWLENLAQLNVCSKKGISSQFDKTVGGQTVLYPYGGRYRETPEQGLAMRLPLIEGNTDLGAVMTVGYDPKAGYASPFHAAYYSVVESVLRAVSMGAMPDKIRLSFQEYFQRMAEKESWGKVYSALMGAFLAQDILEIPSIGGKDSMSGSYEDINVPPTLISFAVAPIDCRRVVSKAFKQAGSRVYLLACQLGEDGLPREESLKANLETLVELIDEGKVLATSVVGSGGIAGEISKMCFGNMIGFSFSEEFTQNLFESGYANVILESTQELPLALMGTTTESQTIRINGSEITLAEALESYSVTLADTFETENYTVKQGLKSVTGKTSIKGIGGDAKALIPIFSGTNGEYSLERQLKKAGFTVESCIFRSLDPTSSYKELAAAIDGCNLLAIPSGMSGGAEANDSGRFISIVLSDPEVSEAINRLIERKGLIIGLGEGFKALVDLGLIQHGTVKEKTDSLDLVGNPLDKHCSGLFKTRAICEANPFSAGISEEIVPVSTRDGRVTMTQGDFDRYYSNGQVVSVFAEDNPFGSPYGIEAMVSENGQVFGRLGEISQLEEGLYINVFAATSSQVFKNMKNYF